MLTLIESNIRHIDLRVNLAKRLLQVEPYHRGRVHAQDIKGDHMKMLELFQISARWMVPKTRLATQNLFKPNLPWAEDHFLERVSGEPLNPPPSEAYWPYAQQSNGVHKKDEKFSHTYPERFWPRMANAGGKIDYSERQVSVPHVGIRYEYGSLGDLVTVLQNDRNTRQAYLPVWFPEDLAAGVEGERVPCSLGYHFMYMPNKGELDVTYFLRSCDFVRFFDDDMYMAARLLQWVCTQTGMIPGNLHTHIVNLHCFEGDRHYLAEYVKAHDGILGDPRKNYNFQGLM